MTHPSFRPILPLLLALAIPSVSLAQQEGPQPTQALVGVESKSSATLTPSSVSLQLNGKSTPLTAFTPLRPAQTQIAILIDDGLRTSVARQLDDIRKFIQGLPQGTEVFVGYMSNGRVTSALPFTTSLASAAASLRIPFGTPGISASPYFCLSDFAKNWPTESSSYGTSGTPGRKARFVLMLTNGVDPYNGSVSITNQNSPYVQAAIDDSQRAGIVVSSIYYADAGIGGGAASFSGQSYLSQVAEATGGVSYYQGRINPVDLTPYLNRFKQDVAQTYVAAFDAPPTRDLLRLKVKAETKGFKVRSAAQLRPGAEIVSFQ